MTPPAKPSARHANLVARVSPQAKAGLERLAEKSGRTQAAVIEGLIARALGNFGDSALIAARPNCNGGVEAASINWCTVTKILLGIGARPKPNAINPRFLSRAIPGISTAHSDEARTPCISA